MINDIKFLIQKIESLIAGDKGVYNCWSVIKDVLTSEIKWQLIINESH